MSADDSADERWLVVLNWSDEPAAFDAPAVETGDAENGDRQLRRRAGRSRQAGLRPYEAVVYCLEIEP